MTVIIRPDGDQNARDLLQAVEQATGESATWGFGGVPLSDDQAHAYLSHKLGKTAEQTGDADETPARRAPAKKATPAKKTTAARGRTARGTGA